MKKNIKMIVLILLIIALSLFFYYTTNQKNRLVTLDNSYDSIKLFKLHNSDFETITFRIYNDSQNTNNTYQLKKRSRNFSVSLTNESYIISMDTVKISVQTHNASGEKELPNEEHRMQFINSLNSLLPNKEYVLAVTTKNKEKNSLLSDDINSLKKNDNILQIITITLN